MKQQPQPKPTLIGSIIFLVGGIYGALELWPPPYGDEAMKLAAIGCIALATLGSYRILKFTSAAASQIIKLIRALGGKDTSKGSAGWLTENETRKARLHKRTKNSRFAGTIGASPLWLDTETHHLILGPSGTQKSTSAIMNILASCPDSALVNDVKGELFETTALMRQTLFGHETIKIDPKDPSNSAKINVLAFIAVYVEADSPEALTLTRGMALQLYPEPSSQDMNKFFRDGARILMVTVILSVIVVMPDPHRTMATVFRALNDLDILHDLLERAAKSKALNGEVANMAESQFASAFGDDGGSKTFEQFRLGALQAIEAFGPGNYLAAITNETTFSFADLKSKKLTCYLIIDYANKDVLGKFSGLMQWLAAYQLVHVGNNKPVLFVLDEFCNSPLHTLPTILTLLRTYGVKCVLATQDLDDIERVYSKHALESVLSETEIKQFLGGIKSQKTLEYLSKALGEITETAPSYSLGREGVQESLASANRKLLTEEEIRRLSEGAQIIFFKNLRPLLARKVQIFAVHPWRKKLAPNSLYGGKMKYLPIEVRVGWFGTRVTERGRKAYRTIKKQMRRPSIGLVAVLRKLDFGYNDALARHRDACRHSDLVLDHRLAASAVPIRLRRPPRCAHALCVVPLHRTGTGDHPRAALPGDHLSTSKT